MHHSLQYHSHIQEIPNIRKDLKILEQEWSIPGSELRQIQLIIEEIFSNIVRFAYEDQQEHMIEVNLSYSENQIEIEFIDDGITFDPLEYNLNPRSDPATPETGGMGLTLIRAFSSNISYQRISGHNHLKIVKRLKSK